MELNVKNILVIGGTILGAIAGVNIYLKHKKEQAEDRRFFEDFKQKHEAFERINKSMDDLSKDMSKVIDSINSQIFANLAQAALKHRKKDD